MPVRQVEWVTDENNLAVLLKPKFKQLLLVKYLIPKLKRPNYKISLDRFGTMVWKNCDGKNTVAEIGELLKKEFGEELESVYERLGLFVQTLKKSGLIDYVNYQI